MPPNQSTPVADGHRLAHLDSQSAQENPQSAVLEAAHQIRHRVFVEEQGVPEDLEWDELDGCAEHFVLFSESEAKTKALGTARLRYLAGASDAKAERVAVLHSARGKGLGRILMDAVESTARRHDRTMLRLNAQVTAVPFYEALGYAKEGDLFQEAGIDHYAMSKSLD